MRWREHLAFKPLLHHAALKHDNNFIRDRFDYRDVMGNKNIGNVQLFLQTKQQLENAFLHNLIQRILSNSDTRAARAAPFNP